jgi:hypothetical protein
LKQVNDRFTPNYSLDLFEVLQREEPAGDRNATAVLELGRASGFSYEYLFLNHKILPQ